MDMVAIVRLLLWWCLGTAEQEVPLVRHSPGPDDKLRQKSRRIELSEEALRVTEFIEGIIDGKVHVKRGAAGEIIFEREVSFLRKLSDIHSSQDGKNSVIEESAASVIAKALGIYKYLLEEAICGKKILVCSPDQQMVEVLVLSEG